LVSGAPRRSELESKLATYRMALPKESKTIEECDKATELYGQMISMAKMHIAEVNKQESTTKMQSGIPHYTSEAERLGKLIDKEEPFGRSRFTDALEAGLQCMPAAGHSLEERYCVAKNKHDMALMILGRLRNFMDNTCLESKTIRKQRGNCNFPSKYNPCETEEVDVCLRTKYDTDLFDDDTLLESAKDYCSTTCQ